MGRKFPAGRSPYFFFFFFRWIDVGQLDLRFCSLQTGRGSNDLETKAWTPRSKKGKASQLEICNDVGL